MMMMMRRSLVFISLLGLSILFDSCLNNNDGGTTAQEQLQQDIVSIDDYLSNKGIAAVRDVNGVRMVIDTLGKGLPSSFSTTVNVRYVGKLFTNGTVFDQGTISGAPTKFIAGWQIALTTLPEGSHATVYIPSVYAYGTANQDKIPANSILVFDMKVLSVTRTPDYLAKIASDSVAIDNYLTSKGITDAVKDSTGIRYVITEAGTGNIPSWYNKIKFTYTLKLLTNDTKVVETNTIAPTSEFYSRVVDYIDGLKIGFQQIKEGTKATFYIPSGLAYGSSSSATIPANSILIFEIDFIDLVE